jgi:hypothetical protein
VAWRHRPVGRGVAIAALAVLVASTACDRTLHGAVSTDAGATPASSAPPLSPEASPDSLSPDAVVALQALREAIKNDAGLSDCDLAYETTAGFADLRSGPGDGPAPVPDRRMYLAECEKLPVIVQRCFDFLYGSSHRADCDQVMATVDTVTRAQLEQLAKVPHAARGRK